MTTSVRMRTLTIAAALAVSALLLAGCGGSGLAPKLADELGTILPGKIIEYEGDGHGGTKPFPAAVLAAPANVETQAISTRLQVGGAAKVGKTQKRRVNWYCIDPHTLNAWLVVTVQPLSANDADLYIIEPTGSDYVDGADCYRYSDRLPTDNGDHPKDLGYAPDWVCWRNDIPSPFPSAQVAVYGPEDAGPAFRRYLIECEQVRSIPPGGRRDSVGHRNSNWYRIWEPSGGVQYTVSLTDVTGDPDLFVYRGSSTNFIDSDISPGGGSVTFTAPTLGYYYMRVYGYADGLSRYTITVTSP